MTSVDGTSATLPGNGRMAGYDLKAALAVYGGPTRMLVLPRGGRRNSRGPEDAPTLGGGPDPGGVRWCAPASPSRVARYRCRRRNRQWSPLPSASRIRRSFLRRCAAPQAATAVGVPACASAHRAGRVVHFPSKNSACPLTTRRRLAFLSQDHPAPVVLGSTRYAGSNAGVAAGVRFQRCGPSAWTERPVASTATVTGMFSTSNS